MMPCPDMSIILPVHNQADHIQTVVRAYQKALSRLPVRYELILVVNACRDDSLTRCRELAADDRIRVIHCEQGGWGYAVGLGLQCAGGRWLCYTNSARTDARDLCLLLTCAMKNPQAVIKATRQMRERWHRRLGSWLFNMECRALFAWSYRDINGTPKIFPRTCKSLLSLRQPDDLLDAAFLAVCHRERYPVIEVPIVSRRRKGGKSTTGMRSALKLYRGALWLWYAHKRGAI